jgi:hypothetical protein
MVIKRILGLACDCTTGSINITQFLTVPEFSHYKNVNHFNYCTNSEITKKSAVSHTNDYYLEIPWDKNFYT